MIGEPQKHLERVAQGPAACAGAFLHSVDRHGYGVPTKVLLAKWCPSPSGQRNIYASVCRGQEPALAAEPAGETGSDNFDGARQRFDGCDDLAPLVRDASRRQIASHAQSELAFHRRHLFRHQRDSCRTVEHEGAQQNTGTGLVGAQQALRLLTGRADFVSASGHAAQRDDGVLDGIGFILRFGQIASGSLDRVTKPSRIPELGCQIVQAMSFARLSKPLRQSYQADSVVKGSLFAPRAYKEGVADLGLRKNRAIVEVRHGLERRLCR
jgi:hypothetical protein